ncbi:hypothetical protein B0H13DRAFT_2389342 [Mycena leptocephala]|nr:hypothetical protein B0H13DRAFT_2389342 [Mycena leptocephala]
MSNIPLVQPDVLDSMIRSPALAFFESQKGIDATALLGTYEYPMDFHLRDSESALPESRLKVKMLSAASDHTAIRFSNDIFVLSEVMQLEESELSIICRSWTELGDKGTGEDLLLVDCGPFTKIVNGPLAVGTCVVLDITLHRHHANIGNIVAKAYSIVAHEVECVGRFYLRKAGVIEHMDLGMTVNEEEMKFMQYCVENTSLDET